MVIINGVSVFVVVLCVCEIVGVDGMCVLFGCVMLGVLNVVVVFCYFV